MKKKGWLRIVEAFIAIALIASVLVIVYVRSIEKSDKSEEISKLQTAILEEVASDPVLRNAVINFDNETVINFVKTRVPPAYNSTVRICEINDICNLNQYKENTYSSERIISGTLVIYNPKKLKIFMWID